MDEKIILKRNSANVMLYAPRNIKVEPTEFQRIDSEILAFIPKN